MGYATHWAKLTDREAPFLAGWTWLVTGFTLTCIGILPLMLHMGWENVAGLSEGNPIGLGLLAMLGMGLGQLCVLIAIIWIGYGILRKLFSSIS